MLPLNSLLKRTAYYKTTVSKGLFPNSCNCLRQLLALLPVACHRQLFLNGILFSEATSSIKRKVERVIHFYCRWHVSAAVFCSQMVTWHCVSNEHPSILCNFNSPLWKKIRWRTRTHWLGNIEPLCLRYTEGDEMNKRPKWKGWSRTTGFQYLQ